MTSDQERAAPAHIVLGSWQKEHDALGKLIELLDAEPSIGDAEMADALERARCAWDHSRVASSAAPAQQPVADEALERLKKLLRRMDYRSGEVRHEAGEAIYAMFVALASSEPELRAEIVSLTRERDFEQSSRLTSEAQLGAQIENLIRERDEARGIVRDIHWMAVRYADNRKSYAVGMCNDALRKAYDGGWLVYKGDKQHDLDPQYARDGNGATS